MFEIHCNGSWYTGMDGARQRALTFRSYSKHYTGRLREHRRVIHEPHERGIPLGPLIERHQCYGSWSCLWWRHRAPCTRGCSVYRTASIRVSMYRYKHNKNQSKWVLSSTKPSRIPLNIVSLTGFKSNEALEGEGYMWTSLIQYRAYITCTLTEKYTYIDWEPLK